LEGKVKEASVGFATDDSMAEGTESIIRTVLNYVEGWYEAKAGRMAEALHPKLAKRGISATGEIYDVDRDWMIEAAGKGQGRIDAPAAGKKEITILDRSPTIASVKLVSNQFNDYLHLAKIEGEWKIIHALWEYR
jgi:hypothetical protein